MAPNLQSRKCDQTSTKITRQNNLRYIKPNVSHRNPIFVAKLEISSQLFYTPLLTFLVAAGKKIVKSRNTNHLPLLFDEFYIIIIYYFRSAELDDILEEESDDDNSSASPPVISSPSSNSPDGSFRLPGSSSRHRNQQVNTESTSSASSTDGRVGTPPLTSRSKGPSSRSSGRVSFTIFISKSTYLEFN